MNNIELLFYLIASYYLAVKSCSCCCALGGICSLICSLAFVIASIVIFNMKQHELFSGVEWQSVRISNSSLRISEPRWIPFDPNNCPKDDQFYSQPFLIYLNARFDGSYYAGLTLTLYDRNDTQHSNEIGSCTIPFTFPVVNEYKTCQVQVPRLDNVYAYVSYRNNDSSEDTVEWGCSYYNIPYLVSAIVLGLCACICLSCCFHTCFSCVKCISSNSTKENQTTYNKRSPSPTVVALVVPERIRTRETKPVQLKKCIEMAIINGIAVRREVTTFQKVNDYGEVEVYEQVQVIGTDGENAVVVEETKGYKS